MAKGPRDPGPLPLVEIFGTYGLYPHLVYANMDFERTEAAEDAPRLLVWLKRRGLPGSWTEKRTLLFLKQHQQEFRNCLRWLCYAAVYDYEFDDEAGGLRGKDFLKKWHNESEVRFFQKHALDHGGVRIEPLHQNRSFLYKLRLVQKQPKDPVDIICWSMLSLAIHHSTLFVHPCEYQKCGKFIEQRTRRKRFCDDSCRSLEHQRRKFRDDPEGFRKDKAAYMRKNRRDRKLARKW